MKARKTFYLQREKKKTTTELLSLFLIFFRKLLIEILFSQRSPVTALIK